MKQTLLLVVALLAALACAPVAVPSSQTGVARAALSAAVPVPLLISSQFAGLDPTGTTDSTAGLQAFFTAARNRRAVLQAGTYLISSTLIWGYNPATEPAPGGSWGNRPMLAGVMQGEGWGSTIIKWGGPLSPGVPMIVFSNPMSRFEDIQINGSKKAGYGLVGHHTGHAKIRVFVDACYGDGIFIKGNWYGPGLDVHGSNDHTYWDHSRSYNSVTGSGFHLPTDAGAEQGGQTFDGCISEGNALHGYWHFGQGSTFANSNAEGNGGWGYVINGVPGGTTATDNMLLRPWTEGNHLGGIHFANASRNVVLTSAGFQGISQEADSDNCIINGSTGGFDVEGLQKLAVRSSIAGAPSISATGTSGQTGQPISISSVKLASQTIAWPATSAGQKLTVDVSKAARIVVNLRASIGTLELTFPANAQMANSEIILDIIQLDAGHGYTIGAWTATKPKADGSGTAPLTMRFVGGRTNPPPVGAQGAATKSSSHDIIRLLYTGDWIEESRTMYVSL